MHPSYRRIARDGAELAFGTTSLDLTRAILPRPTHQSQKKMKTRMKGSTGKRELKATVPELVVPCFQPSDRGEGELKATVREHVVPCFQPKRRAGRGRWKATVRKPYTAHFTFCLIVSDTCLFFFSSSVFSASLA
jgi:hypothetical protein